MLSALLQDRLMAAMHAIKITDGRHAATLRGCQIVQTSNDVHGTSAVLKAFDYNERAGLVQVKIAIGPS
ncbi:hypothetical protein GCM10007158_27150 [Vreelandella hamiltonii]|uniref:Uncharacterized protein n=1 Tax=Halomonas johnsoniae TaxID=502832 RepID=A0ABQ2WRE8_9GAMM|nr:hypothetical protein GCM10007158_27150 [Halomonas johnsoniae]